MDIFLERKVKLSIDFGFSLLGEVPSALEVAAFSIDSHLIQFFYWHTPDLTDEDKDDLNASNTNALGMLTDEMMLNVFFIPNVTENLDLGPSQSPGVGRLHLAHIANMGDDAIAPTAGAFASSRNQIFSHVGYIEMDQKTQFSNELIYVFSRSKILPRYFYADQLTNTSLFIQGYIHLQQALLGKISASLRATHFDVSESEMRITFFYDQSYSDLDKNLNYKISHELRSSLQGIKLIVHEKIVAEPNKLSFDERGWLVFSRKTRTFMM